MCLGCRSRQPRRARRSSNSHKHWPCDGRIKSRCAQCQRWGAFSRRLTVSVPHPKWAAMRGYDHPWARSRRAASMSVGSKPVWRSRTPALRRESLITVWWISNSTASCFTVRPAAYSAVARVTSSSVRAFRRRIGFGCARGTGGWPGSAIASAVS